MQSLDRNEFNVRLPCQGTPDLDQFCEPVMVHPARRIEVVTVIGSGEFECPLGRHLPCDALCSGATPKKRLEAMRVEKGEIRIQVEVIREVAKLVVRRQLEGTFSDN